MSYDDHFKHADDIILHLNGVMPSVTDPLLSVKYVGFVSVAAVTVYELAVKDIFIDFARKKHKILGSFTENFFERINGRIKICNIKDDYIKKYGNKYNQKFETLLNKKATDYMTLHRRDIKSSYSNLIIWRNDFAHEGKVNSTATYNEVVQSYEDGKEIIHCLAQAMTR